MNREQLKQQIVRNFEDAEITEKERLINVMQCIDAHIEQLRIGVVSNCECKNLPKGEIAISSKALTDPNWKG